MSITMYTASVPGFERQLSGLLAWLDKAEAHAQARGFDTGNYLQLRLAPDMLPLVAQIRIASDMAKSCVRATSPEALEGSERREVVIPMRNRDALRFGGEFYLKHWALPNFMFHCSMAYALLRHAGVPLGKADFLALE